MLYVAARIASSLKVNSRQNVKSPVTAARTWPYVVRSLQFWNTESQKNSIILYRGGASNLFWPMFTIYSCGQNTSRLYVRDICRSEKLSKSRWLPGAENDRCWVANIEISSRQFSVHFFHLRTFHTSDHSHSHHAEWCLVFGFLFFPRYLTLWHCKWISSTSPTSFLPVDWASSLQ